MGFRRKLYWLILVLMPLFIFTGCGDLEPEMQDTRTVILNMDFHGKSSSRSIYSVSASELSQYNTHLILALPSWEYLTSNYRNYYSSFAQGLMNAADKKVSLEIPLNTQMKIFAFLFKDTYSLSDLISGFKEVGYYGESQPFSIDEQTNNLSLGISLQSTDTGDGGGTDPDTDTGTETGDTTAPIIEQVTAIESPTNDSTPEYTFASTKVGSITYAGACYSATIICNIGNNVIVFNALSDGYYDDCTIKIIDSEGNESNTLTIPAFTIDTTVPDNTAPTASVIAATITTSGNAVVQSTETGTAYLVKTTVSVSDVITNNTVPPDSQWNSVTISSANFNTNLPATGLENGTYKVYAVDTAGNISIASINSVTVATISTLPAPDNLSASGANNTIILTWNSVSGATSYTLYWDNVSGIDNSDTPINSITNDNYTHSNMDNGSIYYYKVAAVNSSGTGTLSSVAGAILAQNIQASKTFNDHTYALTSTQINWNDAKTAATALGGYLTTVNTKAENDWLTAIFNNPYGQSWIGANDIATTNTWVWDNGTTDNDNGLTDNICGSNGCPNSNATWADNITSKWASDEPNRNGASCGYIWTTSGTWDDIQCIGSKYAIIEFDL